MVHQATKHNKQTAKVCMYVLRIVAMRTWFEVGLRTQSRSIVGLLPYRMPVTLVKVPEESEQQ
jgi:hypothetical protein